MSVDQLSDDVVEITTTTERWRLECPVEHRGSKIEPRDDDGHWFCRRCDEKGIDPRYTFVRDQKTGRYLAPDEVEINIIEP